MFLNNTEVMCIESLLARQIYQRHYPTYDQIGYVNKMSKNIFIENNFEFTDVRKVLKRQSSSETNTYIINVDISFFSRFN